MYYSKPQLINLYKKYFYDDGGSSRSNNINGSYGPHIKDNIDYNGMDMPAVPMPNQNADTDTTTIQTVGIDNLGGVTAGVPTKFHIQLG